MNGMCLLYSQDPNIGRGAGSLAAYNAMVRSGGGRVVAVVMEEGRVKDKGSMRFSGLYEGRRGLAHHTPAS